MILSDFVKTKENFNKVCISHISSKMRISRQAAHQALKRNVKSFKVSTLLRYAKAFGGDLELKFIKKR